MDERIFKRKMKAVWDKVGTSGTNPNWKEDLKKGVSEMEKLQAMAKDAHFLSRKEWKERDDTLNLENEQKHQFVIMYVCVVCKDEASSSKLYDLLLTVFNDGFMYPQKHGDDDIYHIYAEARNENIFIEMLSDYWERVGDVLKTVRMTTGWIVDENWSK